MAIDLITMPHLLETATRWLRAGQSAVLVDVVETQGSVPREVGARMLVAGQSTAGTVGGGHLELQAIEHARRLLGAAPGAEAASVPSRVRYPLGPRLGQCCGGVVTLGFEPLSAAALARWPTTPARFHLQLHGAGHVGRAIARLLADLPVSVDWIDERCDGFPQALGPGPWPAHIRPLSVDAAEDEVSCAAPGDRYLVLTHRHDLDLRITASILARGDFGFLGLIGSHTKKQRFLRHFADRGVPAERLDRIVCPIGLPGIEGKQPEVLALSAVAQLLLQPVPGAASQRVVDSPAGSVSG